MKRALVFLLSALITGCTGTLDIESSAPASFSGIVIHGGWTHVQAMGPKEPAAQASDLSAAAATVTLQWAEMSSGSEAISSYNIYRAITSGGQDLASPLATGIDASVRSYTDATVAAGTSYYYVVLPVIAGALVQPESAADEEIKVIVPRENMVLLHRWIANKDMCELMGKTADRTQDYRCDLGGGYFDLGHSLFVDRFEQGCNYTYSSTASKCGSADGCIGILNTPHTFVTANRNDIYYSRRSQKCFINTSAVSGTTWVEANLTTAANRQLMGSAQPGLPPYPKISQPQAQEVCAGQSVSGFTGTKRLMRRKEFVLAAAWDGGLTDTQIDTLENGVNLDQTKHCNTNAASPQGSSTVSISATNPTIAFDNLASPTAKDTSPGCLNGDCAAAAFQTRALRTGSLLTSACVSRYGAQDLVGNMWEWTSDQLNCASPPGTCTGVAAASNTADSTNDDFNGVVFDGVQGPTTTNSFSSFGKIQFPMGIPIAGASSVDGTVTLSSAQAHGDYFAISVVTNLRGLLSGNRPSAAPDGAGGGRFSLAANNSAATTNQGFGFRCVFVAD